MPEPDFKKITRQQKLSDIIKKKKKKVAPLRAAHLAVAREGISSTGPLCLLNIPWVTVVRNS